MPWIIMNYCDFFTNLTMYFFLILSFPTSLIFILFIILYNLIHDVWIIVYQEYISFTFSFKYTTYIIIMYFRIYVQNPNIFAHYILMLKKNYTNILFNNFFFFFISPKIFYFIQSSLLTHTVLLVLISKLYFYISQ